jgi:hypothetical protein
MEGPSGRAVRGEGLDRLDAEIVSLNPAYGMHVCPRLSVVLSCVGRGVCDGLITRPKESYQCLNRLRILPCEAPRSLRGL